MWEMEKEKYIPDNTAWQASGFSQIHLCVFIQINQLIHFLFFLKLLYKLGLNSNFTGPY